MQPRILTYLVNKLKFYYYIIFTVDFRIRYNSEIKIKYKQYNL